MLGFHHLPKDKGNYSYMEVINIIIVIIWMEYIGMNEYLCKSTTKSRKYNKMDVNGDGDVGDAAVDDEDDAQASNDPNSGEDR